LAEAPKSIPQVMTELKDLTVSYAKQETIEPVKGLGRFVAWGVSGSLVLAIGLGMIGLAGLRFMQSETGSMFTGSWSWAPYLIATAFLAVLAGASIAAIRRSERR
jgi:hypothetical protein